MKRNVSILIIIFSCYSTAAQDSITVSKIWDKAKYSAFTDLIRFNDAFYCSFREGTSHVGRENDGKVRVIKSRNGDNWESVALLDMEGVDLRDPKLSVTPNKELMIIMAGAVYGEDGERKKLYPLVSFSDKLGKEFSTPEKAILDPAITPSDDWLWRVTWHNEIGYGINYQLKEKAKSRDLLGKDAWLIYLMKTKDGKHFEKVSKLEVEDLPNESTVRFDKDGKMYVLIRKEAGDKMGVLATSQPPFKDWEYTDLKFRLGGPNFLFLNEEKILIGTRLYKPEGALTGILVTDLKGNVSKTIVLPSGGDTSYPGMVIYKKKLWVSYYSSHEERPSIYLAKIPLSMLKL